MTVSNLKAQAYKELSRISAHTGIAEETMRDKRAEGSCSACKE